MHNAYQHLLYPLLSVLLLQVLVFISYHAIGKGEETGEGRGKSQREEGKCGEIISKAGKKIPVR